MGLEESMLMAQVAVGWGCASAYLPIFVCGFESVEVDITLNFGEFALTLFQDCLAEAVFRECGHCCSSFQ